MGCWVQRDMCADVRGQPFDWMPFNAMPIVIYQYYFYRIKDAEATPPPLYASDWVLFLPTQ